MTGLVIPFGGRLIALFGVGSEAVAIGSAFFTRLAAFYVVYGLAAAIRGYIEGLGDVTYSSITGILSLLSRIILSYACVSFLGDRIIAYAEAFSWVFLLLLYIFRLIWKYRQEKTEQAAK